MPLPGYVLLFTPELMPAINFDVLYFVEKYWREVDIFDYLESEHLLGINFVTFGYESIHFVQNTKSCLGLTLLLLALILLFIWCIKKKRVRNYMIDSLVVLFKTIAYMVFIVSAAIQLKYNGDDGMQTALAILTLCFLGLVLPIYLFFNSCKRKTFPSRQDLTMLLRASTCMIVFWGTQQSDY